MAVWRGVVSTLVFGFLAVSGAARSQEALVPQDQIQFEEGVSHLNALINESRLESSNRFRVESLAKEYQSRFAEVFQPRRVTGWICKYDSIDESMSGYTAEFAGKIPLTCRTANSTYVLLIPNTLEKTEFLSALRYGGLFTFSGRLYEDLDRLKQFQANVLYNHGPVIFLDD